MQWATRISQRNSHCDSVEGMGSREGDDSQPELEEESQYYLFQMLKSVLFA